MRRIVNEVGEPIMAADAAQGVNMSVSAIGDNIDPMDMDFQFFGKRELQA